MTISYEGQVAIITGAGGGIGKVQALELAARPNVKADGSTRTLRKRMIALTRRNAST
jgi:NAD(P)-dependent dehydrogenase (short-subunit alcohol dehydrogenase family)